MTKAVSLARSVSNTGLLLDGDLSAIAALSGTVGLLKKNAANTWSLDTSTYLTSITSSNVTTALGYTPENPANKGAVNGYASLDGSGKVPASQLPSYVDDVLEYANQAALPASGETAKIYVTLDNNKVYRWSGSAYVEVSPSPGSTDGVAEGSSNLYYTDTRVQTKLGNVSGHILPNADITYDLGSSTNRFRDLYLSGSTINLGVSKISTAQDGGFEFKSAADQPVKISLSANTTTDLAEGTNLYYTTARANTDFDTRLATKSTTNLAEGTNLYYTDTRARLAISVAGSGSYDSSTGVITVTGGVTSVNARTGAVTLTSTDVGLSNVENKSSATIRGELTSGNVTTALTFTPENSANRAQANGYASLDGSGKVPASQLPSYVDDVLEYANQAALPASGETGKLYLTLDNNKVYRWSGSAYVEIVASPSSTDSVVEGSTNLYYTSTRANSDFDTRLATKSTTNLAEGTNLYYTNARVDTRIAATSINALSDVDTATSAPSNGQGLIWNSTTSSWVPGNVAANLTGSTTRTVTTITATSGQTTFNASGGYTVGYVDVYQNGIKLVGGGDDYTATNGLSVVFTQGAAAGDSVEIVAYQLATVVSTAGPKAGGGIIVNKTLIDENYTFPSNHNGFSIGPVIVASGVTVSIPSGQRWLVV
jgi:hypothetical protein